MSSLKLALNKRQWLVAIVLILIVLISILWTKFSKAATNRIVKETVITINKKETSYFLNTTTVTEILRKAIGNPSGMAAADINTQSVEALLLKNPFVKKAEVYIGLDGVFTIKIEERKPIVLVENIQGETFFLDTQGIMIPNLINQFPDVLIASGQIAEKLKPGKQISQLITKELLRLSAFIAADSLWNAQFQQLYVDNYQELILIPRVGKHSIVVGNAEDLPVKFENLRLFYNEGFKTVGWERYKQLDISIRNQVIGRGTVQNSEQKENQTEQ